MLFNNLLMKRIIPNRTPKILFNWKGSSRSYMYSIITQKRRKKLKNILGIRTARKLKLKKKAIVEKTLWKGRK
jgi:hypothetical protein